MNLIKTNIVSPDSDVFWEDTIALTDAVSGRPVLVLVNRFDPGATDGAQLQKMLDACKLKPEHYNIVQLQDGQAAAWRQLRDFLNPKIIFLIGIMPSQLGISALFRLNYPNNFDGRVWLPTLSVSDLAKHDDVKKELWVSGMKPVFVDNPQVLLINS